jgi:hypothetical protein
MKMKSRSNVKVPKIIEHPNEPVKYTVADCCNQPPKDMKTSGVKIRGTGAATKGTMARGPMA